MRIYLNIISFIFYAFLMFTSQYSILNLWLKCRVHSDFQGSLLCSHLDGSVSIILFDCFLGVLEKRLLREWKIFLNHWIWKFSKFQFLIFSFLKFINFKITTNSFIYSLVEQFLETHFHKNNLITGGEWYTFGKNLTKFSGLYPPDLGCGGILYEQHASHYLS